MFVGTDLYSASAMEEFKDSGGAFSMIAVPVFSMQGGADISRAIFGKDDRQELFPSPARWRESGRSIAGKVSADHITDHGSYWELHGDPLSQKECPGNRFADQITVPSCTGFL